jgi:hypothetical protein
MNTTCSQTIAMAAVIIAFIALTAHPTTAQTSSPTDRPALSVEAIRKLHDAGQYRSALQEAARTLRTPVGERDKFQLQLIRGDCLLHQDDAPTALSAYAVAAKSPDANQSDVARAMSLLIRSSRDLKYTPKTGGDAIDIIDHDSRTRGAAALLADKLASDRTDIDAALSADNLQPILAVIDPILDMIALEYVATGKDAQTHAMGQRVANQIIDDGGNGVTRRGLISTQRQELRDMIDYLAKIHTVAERGRQLAVKYNGPVDQWERILRDTTGIGRHASDVLAAE